MLYCAGAFFFNKLLSTDKLPAPPSINAKVPPNTVKGNSKPMGLKKPFLRCTVNIATIMTIDNPTAA